MHHAGPGADAVGLGRENVTENLNNFLRTEPTQPIGESDVHLGILMAAWSASARPLAGSGQPGPRNPGA